MAEIDLAKVADARQRIPTLKHTRTIEIARAGLPPQKAAE